MGEDKGKLRLCGRNRAGERRRSATVKGYTRPTCWPICSRSLGDHDGGLFAACASRTRPYIHREGGVAVGLLPANPSLQKLVPQI